MIDGYDWPGGREAMIRFGPDAGSVVIAALPLFEEANRTRTFVVAILRTLAERGIASVLPDLPGMGESLIETADATLMDWRTAFTACIATLAATRPVTTLTFRGGALVDSGAVSRWCFAPITGDTVVRDLIRIRQAAAREAGETFDPEELAPPGPPVELGGNRIARRLLAELRAADITLAGRTRTVRLDSDPAPADRHVPGMPLWRRGEPGHDPALAALLADDIAAWVTICAG